MTELLDGCGVAVRWSGSGRQCPTASLRHFSVKLVLAAPASFLPAAALSQDACASFSHFVMKLVERGPGEPLCACLAFAGVRHGGAREHATIHGGNPF